MRKKPPSTFLETLGLHDCNENFRQADFVHNLGKFETVGGSSGDFASIEGVYLIKLKIVKKAIKMKGHQV